MKLLQQFVLLMGIILASHILVVLLKIPIPATIVAMMLLLLLLETKTLKTEWFDKVTGPLLAHITLFLLPPSLAFAGAVNVLKGLWIQVIVIVIVSATVIIAVTAKTIEWMMKKEEAHASSHRKA